MENGKTLSAEFIKFFCRPRPVFRVVIQPTLYRSLTSRISRRLNCSGLDVPDYTRVYAGVPTTTINTAVCFSQFSILLIKNRQTAT